MPVHVQLLLTLDFWPLHSVVCVGDMSDMILDAIISLALTYTHFLIRNPKTQSGLECHCLISKIIYSLI